MLSFAVIGVGRMGGKHAQNILKGKIAGARLVAVCDVDVAKLAEFSVVKTFTNYKEMVEKVQLDGVIVAVPHYGHEEICVYCMEKGLNVLCEKPLSVGIASARRMVNVAKNGKGIYAIMYNQRTNRLYSYVKQLVSTHALGEIVRASLIISDWYRSQAYYNQGGWRASYNGEGGGVLINQCVHQLDILQWILGAPHAIIADNKTVNRNITVENDVTSILKYDGFNCTFTASTHELKGTNRLEIAGTLGRVVVDKYKMLYIKHEKSEPQVNSETVKGYGTVKSKKIKKSYGLSRLIYDSTTGQQARILTNFAKTIAGKTELLSPMIDGINALEIINGIYLSGWTRSEVTLPLDGEAYEKALEAKRVHEKALKQDD